MKERPQLGRREIVGDITGSPLMKEMDNNQGFMIIRDASHKHTQILNSDYFRRDLIKR